MKVAVMQPYLFPYIGYFQLIGAVDTFVVHDDVQYIKGGWINRNRLLVHGEPRYFTLPVRRASSALCINQRVFASSFERDKQKVLRRIEEAYHRASYFDAVFPLLARCLACTERHVSSFTVNALQATCRYLNIDTPFLLSSQVDKRPDLRAQERVLEINEILGATHYINSIGGAGLYDRDRFTRQGLKLSFLRARPTAYRQFQGAHVSSLSIIDVMMFNSVDEITGLLREYDLESG